MTQSAQKILPFVRRYLKTILIVLGAFILFLFMRPSGMKIGILDGQKLRDEAKAYQTIAAEQKKYEDVWRVKLMAEKAVLDKEEQDLRKSKKPSQDKLIALQKKMEKLQARYQEEAQRIMQATQVASKEVDEAAVNIIREIGDKKGYDIILLRGTLVYTGKHYDMTEDVIKILNKKEIKVVYPDPTQFHLP